MRDRKHKQHVPRVSIALKEVDEVQNSPYMYSEAKKVTKNGANKRLGINTIWPPSEDAKNSTSTCNGKITNSVQESQPGVISYSGLGPATVNENYTSQTSSTPFSSPVRVANSISMSTITEDEIETSWMSESEMSTSIQIPSRTNSLNLYDRNTSPEKTRFQSRRIPSRTNSLNVYDRNNDPDYSRLYRSNSIPVTKL